MSIILLYITTFFNFSTNPVVETPIADEIKWYTWEEAAELSKTNPKKVFVDVYTNWCGWCKRMDATTFKESGVVQYLNENFYPVKFNAEQKGTIMFNDHNFEFIASGRRGIHQLAYALLDGQASYPSYVLLDESFARIMVSKGYKQSPQLMKELTFAKEEKYREMTWQDYQTL